MKTVVTVEAAKLEAFREALALTGCRPTGRMRRLGRAADGTPVRDIEVHVPPDGRASRAGLNTLPGVRALFLHGPRGGPWGGGPWDGSGPGWRDAVEDFLFWRITRSGRRAR